MRAVMGPRKEQGVGGWALPFTSWEALGKSPDLLGISAPSYEKRVMRILILCGVVGRMEVKVLCKL